MDREQRKKTIASKKHGPPIKRKHGGCSNNLSGENEEQMIKSFHKLINFRHEGQRKKFE